TGPRPTVRVRDPNLNLARTQPLQRSTPFTPRVKVSRGEKDRQHYLGLCRAGMPKHRPPARQCRSGQLERPPSEALSALHEYRAALIRIVEGNFNSPAMQGNGR